MKISINNFKSIKSLQDYDIKPLTILSGVNSTGKSSFIQLLLILKQTLDLQSARTHLNLDDDLYSVGKYQDILSEKKLDNLLSVSFTFSKDEDIELGDENRLTIFDSFKSYEIKVEIKFNSYKEEIYVSDLSITYLLPDVEKHEQFIKFKTIKDKTQSFSIETNNALFGAGIWGEDPNITDIKYLSVFPSHYEVSDTIVTDGARRKQKLTQVSKVKYFPNIEGVKALLQHKFSSISYIGPIREQPKDEYPMSAPKLSVGKSGEYTAQILENFRKKKVIYKKLSFIETGVEYITVKSTLLEAVKYWMCEVFNIGIDLYSKRKGEAYVIVLVNHSGIETTIKHVGFGVSQVLPIVVEGLLIDSGSTLILEQPEIHLHPRLQSLLYDYLYTLVLQNKNVIIETHSDHFITRMRRRVAEDQSNTVNESLNLTFIVPDEKQVYFEILELDNMGTMDYFPENFIEQSGDELKAILRAQMKKRSH